MKHSRPVYSLAELFVFIAFICLLFSVSVAMLYSAQQDARIAQATADVMLFKRASMIAMAETGKKITEISGSSCSDCLCTIDQFDNCAQFQQKALASIIAATEGVIEARDAFFTDPWGVSYMVNESGGKDKKECSSIIYSSGPDKKNISRRDNIEAEIEGGC